MLALAVTLVLCTVALIALYVWYMSARHGELKRKFGIDGPKTVPVLGNYKGGNLIDGSTDIYKEFKDKKLWASYFGRDANLNISDLDVIRDIMVKNFNNFPDRTKPMFETGTCLDHMLTALTGERWKYVRAKLSPAFSSGKIKRMTKVIQRVSKVLTDNLVELMERNEPVDLQEAMPKFSMDATAGTAFALELNSVKDPNNPFIQKCHQFINGFGKFLAIYIFAPFLFSVMKFFGIQAFDMSTVNFFNNFVERAIQERRGDSDAGKRNDFLQVLVEAEKERMEEEGENGDTKAKQGLTDMEIQAASLVFILAGYDNISRVMAFTLFLLAMNPEHLAKVHEELDSKLEGKEPDYESLAELQYLDQSINEAMRLYPPGFIIQRRCIEDTEIQGLRFPKGYTINIPVYHIHRDPNYWEEPEKFDPGRFSPGRREDRHPYSFLPFGYGPRNCIGLRLSQMEMRLGLATLLQKLTMVKCEKSVHPIKLQKMRLAAEDGLWVKFEPRKAS